MMSVQNLVNPEMNRAETGQLADINPDLQLDTYILGNQFGSAYGRGLRLLNPSVDDRLVESPRSSGDNFVGIAIRVQRVSERLETPLVGYPPRGVVSVLSRGRMYVIASENVTVGDPVYMRFVTDFNFSGTFFKTASAGRVLIPNGVWEEDALVGEITLVKLF